MLQKNAASSGFCVTTSAIVFGGNYLSKVLISWSSGQCSLLYTKEKEYNNKTQSATAFVKFWQRASVVQMQTWKLLLRSSTDMLMYIIKIYGQYCSFFSVAEPFIRCFFFFFPRANFFSHLTRNPYSSGPWQRLLE